MHQSQFHQGEVEIQDRTGERGTAILNGRLIQDSIIVPAHKFLGLQSFIVLSVAVRQDYIPISIIFGKPGFISVDMAGKTIRISLLSHQNMETDPVLKELKSEIQVGALAIDLSTRRRLRVNGQVKSVSPSEIQISVTESYPNCPKYIQKRNPLWSEPPSNAYSVASGRSIGNDLVQIIERSDTFFVSSWNPGGHADASHRGGEPGFVRFITERSILIPDYPGNSLFNTFGNFALNPYAGIVFWDFPTNRFLHIFGSVKLIFDRSENSEICLGTGRWWEVNIEHWCLQSVNVPFLQEFIEASPFNPN